MLPVEKPSSRTIFKRRVSWYTKHPGDIRPDFKDYMNRVFYGSTGKLNLIGGLKYLICKSWYLQYKERKRRMKKREERHIRIGNILSKFGIRWIILMAIILVIEGIFRIVSKLIN